MKVADIMTRNVISVRPDAAVREAARLMLQAHISGVPVIDKNGALVGIVTEGDFLRRAETGTERRRSRWLEILLGPGAAAKDYTQAHARHVESVMTRDVATIAPGAPLDEAVRLMERRHVKRLPVVEGGRVVGIIARANLLHALAQVAPEIPTVAPTDQAIRLRLDEEIRKQGWARAGLVDVTVRNGIVELWGTIFDEREREALKVAAENIPGVKTVRDHLMWVEPFSGFAIPAPEPGERSISTDRGGQARAS